MNVRKWFKRESKGRLRPVELLVLDAIASSLPSDLAEILRAQSSSINLVQRFAHGSEVNFYQKERGKLVAPERLFGFVQEEFLLATVTLKSPESKGLIAVKVWVVNGRLFQLKVNAPLSKMKAEFEVRSVDLNPTLLPEGGVQPKGPILEALSRQWKVTEIQPSLSEERRASALDIIRNVLPPDFLELMREADGFKVDHWTILGLESIYALPGDSKSSVLAESIGETMHRQDLVLIVKSGEYSVLKCVDLADNPIEETTFLAVLKKILSNDLAQVAD